MIVCRTRAVPSLDDTELAPNGDILLLTRLGETADLDPLAEEYTVGGTTKVEHTGRHRITTLSVERTTSKTISGVTHPSCSPFFTCWPSLTVISQVDTSVIPMPMKHINPILGLSASIKMMALAATTEMYS